MLEKMSEFFENRLNGYDRHMMTNIESATEFYPFTASLLPDAEKSRVLDLGCGTGLELEFYYRACPSAKVTGIDLSEGMLSALKKKFPEKDINLIVGSYFDVPLGESAFDAAVSVTTNSASSRLPLLTLKVSLLRSLYFASKSWLMGS